jgi:hypothetical protein
MIIRPPRTGLPRTGQTTSYRAGDDGTYQAGVRAANTRALELVDNGNGTVTDYATGLIWVKDPARIIPGAVGVHATNQIQVAHGNWTTGHVYAAADVVYDAVGATYQVCAVAHTSGAGTFAQDVAANPTWWRVTVWTASAANLTTPATMIWNAAIDACEALEYAGYTDWRLPNVKELFSCMSFVVWDNLWASPLVGLGDAYYQSSTSRVGGPAGHAQVVHWKDWSELVTLGAKTAAYYLRPVRGGMRKA